ncbi:MAG: peptidase T [Deltaproteobacteria bacterium]|nr:peptidase T [Deltaproteobacteria bacterium]
MAVSSEVKAFLREDALRRFLSYVKVYTTSDDESGKTPSSEREFDLARQLERELREIGLSDVETDEFCYVYATLPASPGCKGPVISFCAHLDTSGAAPGENVKPVFHRNYDGGVIAFADDPDLRLGPPDSPELSRFVGEDIITASGKTLLGADDKAGVAEIVAGLAALKKFPELRHPEIRVCITPDEEIGGGTAKIRTEKLGKLCYTFDGGEVGEIETECFNAHMAKIKFIGVNVHPGYAKNIMLNAGAIAARYVAALPEWQTPEHTELREGFFHLLKIGGDENEASIQFIIRDFEAETNQKRMVFLKSLADVFMKKYPGLKVEVEIKEQYRNMVEVLNNALAVVEVAQKAIEMSGVKVIRKAIRGGTDGAKLCFMGIPTPNVFAGGLLFHSKREWIPVVALERAAEVFVNICGLWYEKTL